MTKIIQYMEKLYLIGFIGGFLGNKGDIMWTIIEIQGLDCGM